MNTNQQAAVASRQSVSRVARCLAAVTLIVTGASTLSAQSNYQPIEKSFRSAPGRSDDSFFSGSRGRDFSRDRYNQLDDAYAPFPRRLPTGGARQRRIEDEFDRYEPVSPRNRDKVPRGSRYDDIYIPNRYEQDRYDSRYDDRYDRRYDDRYNGRYDDNYGDGYQDSYGGSGYDRLPNRIPGPTAPRSRYDLPLSQTEPLPTPQELINRRYQDPAVMRFLGSISPDQALQMYAETLQLIESRHLTPPAPQAMVQRGVANLMTAMQVPAFQQVARMQAGPQQVQAFQQALGGQLQQMPVQTTNDAVRALQMAMQIGSQQLGLSPVIVALEFQYAAIESLDRFSAFVPPETARAFNQQLGASVVGIGVQIEDADRGVRILKVMAGGSAQQAGLQKGDVIVAVNGQSLAGRGLDGSSSLITGPEGSMVTLTVLRNAGGQFQVQVARRSVEIHSVTDVQMLESGSGVAYMKLETFGASSTQEMEQALWSLHQQGMQSLVLDLRGNPGGLLTTAVQIADLFLPQGTIVSTRGRTSADNTSETAKSEQTWKVPLIVLVDENSASASEILAAAIQENGRGQVVGRRTYGKGSVQTLFPLQSTGAGLRLTTAKFYSPKGREMAGQGVIPDVDSVEVPAIEQGDLRTDRDLQAGVDLARRGSVGNYDVSQLGGTRSLYPSVPGVGR